MAVGMHELTENDVREFVKELEKRRIPLHSVLVAQHDKLLLEKYYAPYDRNKLQRMFSVTKSFTALAVGLLEQEGRITLQDPICKYFPEYLPGVVHPWLAELTIEDMLKMQTCHTKTTYNKTSTTENWVRSFFQTEPTHRPGTLFMYDTSSPHVLCARVEKITGQKMLAYLKDKLLRQIGFSEESYIIEDPFGTSMAGSGLMATPRDLLLTGCMLLKHRTDPYITRATNAQTSTLLDGENRWYGYQFWIPMEGMFAMMGLGSQLMIAVPAMKLVVVITADTQGMGGADQLILTAVREKLLLDTFTEETLDRKELPVLKPVYVGIHDDVSGRKYALRLNHYGFGWCSVTFDEEEKTGILSYELKGKVCQLPFGIGHLEEGSFPIYKESCVASAAWMDPHTLYILCWLTGESVASIRFRISFAKNELTVHMMKTEETKYNEYTGFLNS